MRAGDGDLDGAVGAAEAGGEIAAVVCGDGVGGVRGGFGCEEAAEDCFGGQPSAAFFEAVFLMGGEVGGGLQDALICFGVFEVGEEGAGVDEGQAVGPAEGGVEFFGEGGEGEVAAEVGGVDLDGAGHVGLVAGVIFLQGEGVVEGALEVGDVGAVAVVTVGGGEGLFVGKGADGGEEGLGGGGVLVAQGGDGVVAAGAADDFVADGVAWRGAADEAGNELAVGADAGDELGAVIGEDGQAGGCEAALGGVDAGDVGGGVMHGGGAGLWPRDWGWVERSMNGLDR